MDATNMCTNVKVLFFNVQHNCSITNSIVLVDEQTIANISSSLIVNQNQSFANQVARQVLNVYAMEAACRQLIVNQTINQSVGITQDLASSDVEEIKRVMDTEIRRTIDQSLENSQGWFSDLPAEQAIDANIKSIVTQIIEESMTVENVNLAVNRMKGDQEVNMYIGRLNAELCEFNQNTIMDLAVSQLMNVVVDRMIQHEQSSLILTTLAQRLISQTNGPIEALGEKKGSKKAPLMYAAVALGVLALVGGVIALIVRSASGRASETPPDTSESTPESIEVVSDTTLLLPTELTPTVSTSVIDEMIRESRAIRDQSSS